jgi:hypothetical protein
VSWATTCSSVEWVLDSESNSNLVGISTFTVPLRLVWRRLARSCSIWPRVAVMPWERISWTLARGSGLFLGVELEGAEGVGELEAVDDDAGFVGEGVGFDDVHAPGGEGSGDVGEEAAAVAGDDGELDELAVGAEFELNGVQVELGGQQKVVADLLGEAGLQVALRQAFEEFADGFFLLGYQVFLFAVEFGVVGRGAWRRCGRAGWDRGRRGSGLHRRCGP